MPTYSRPGVYVSETVLPRSFSISNSTGLAALVGPADQGPVSSYVQSWREFSRLFGSKTSSKLSMAGYQYFANGGSDLVVVNVVAANAVKAGSAVGGLDITALSGGKWGNGLSLTTTAPQNGYFSLTVYLDGVLVERYTTLTTSDVVSRLSVSEFIAITASPAGAVTAATKSLTGGSDGTLVDSDYQNALKVLDTWEAPLIINLPGVSVAAQVNATLSYAAARGDSFVVIDTAPNLTVDAAIAASASLTKSAYGGIYYPHLVVPDPSPQAVRGSHMTVPPGASVLASITRVDSSYGVWRSPAGPITALSGVTRCASTPNASDLDKLNEAHINAIRDLPGTGPCIMAARTLDSTSAARYVSVRRSLSYLKSQLALTAQFALFEPNGPELWLEVRTRLINQLALFWQDGGLRGSREPQAFYVRCDASNNPPNLVAAGELHIEVGVAVEYPAEFVIIQISQLEGSPTLVVN